MTGFNPDVDVAAFCRAVTAPASLSNAATLDFAASRNAMVHQAICDDIAAFAAAQGCTDIEIFPSSIKGGDGNIEFFIGARRG